MKFIFHNNRSLVIFFSVLVGFRESASFDFELAMRVGLKCGCFIFLQQSLICYFFLSLTTSWSPTKFLHFFTFLQNKTHFIRLSFGSILCILYYKSCTQHSRPVSSYLQSMYHCSPLILHHSQDPHPSKIPSSDWSSSRNPDDRFSKFPSNTSVNNTGVTWSSSSPLSVGRVVRVFSVDSSTSNESSLSLFRACRYKLVDTAATLHTSKDVSA